MARKTNRMLGIKLQGDRYMNGLRSKKDFFLAVLRDRYPSASASLSGFAEFSFVRGTLHFYATPIGVMLSAEINGLPKDRAFGVRIGGKNSRTCYSCELSPLSSNGDCVWFATVSNSFRIEDVIGSRVAVSANSGFFSESSAKSIAGGSIA